MLVKFTYTTYILYLVFVVLAGITQNDTRQASTP